MGESDTPLIDHLVVRGFMSGPPIYRSIHIKFVTRNSIWGRVREQFADLEQRCELGVFRSHCFSLLLLRLIFNKHPQIKKRTECLTKRKLFGSSFSFKLRVFEKLESHRFVKIRPHMHMLRIYGHRHWRRSPRQVSAAHASCIRLQTLTAISPSSLQIAARARRPGWINQVPFISSWGLSWWEWKATGTRPESDRRDCGSPLTSLDYMQATAFSIPDQAGCWKCRHRDGVYKDESGLLTSSWFDSGCVPVAFPSHTQQPCSSKEIGRQEHEHKVCARERQRHAKATEIDRKRKRSLRRKGLTCQNKCPNGEHTKKTIKRKEIEVNTCRPYNRTKKETKTKYK